LQHPGFCRIPTYTRHCAVINIRWQTSKRAKVELFLSRILPFQYSNIHFSLLQHASNFKLKVAMWNKDQEHLFQNNLFLLLLYFLMVKNNFSFGFFIALTIASPFKWGRLELVLRLNVIQNSLRTQHLDRSLTYVRFSIHSTTCHTTIAAKICGSYWNLMKSYGCQRWTQTTVTFTAQINTAYSAIGPVCRIKFLFKVSPATYTHAGTWNNLHVVVTTLSNIM